MQLKNPHISCILLLFFIFFGSSCSTKKKSWVNRQYHNTTAKYNGYFNGNESLKAGVKKLHLNHVDDFTTTISVFPTGDLKKAKKIHPSMTRAIKKGSVVIQRHSMKINGIEYCKWIDDNYLMVGKSYFYKGEFDEAIKTFSYINNEYKKNEIRFNALLWLIRSYTEKRDYSSALSLINELKTDRKFPKKLETDLALNTADLFIQKKDFISAESELRKILGLIKSKRKKVRINYVLAQLYQYSNNYALAKKHYKLVLNSNPEYEMTFNAKMNLARSLEGGDSDLKKIRKELLKMISDDKNKEYLDQLYYTIAEMDITNKDTLAAKDNYTLSTLNSIDNTTQKSLSFLALAEIDFKRGLYKSSFGYYDSTISYMPNDFRLYDKTNARKLVLEDLVLNINIVELEDSLQMLSGLSVSEQNTVFASIIQAEFEKERQAADEERLRQQNISENRFSNNRGEQFGNNTSGGNWYFYNPATISFGVSEFRKKWGTRKLEDDWRRKDKKYILNFDTDSISVDSTLIATKNTKDPKYYFDQLPKSKEEFNISDNQIKEALYQLGLIYRDGLDEIDLSSDQFLSVSQRFPNDKQYASLSLYNVYLNCIKSKSTESQNIKAILLAKYPNSIYSKVLVDTSLTLESLFQKDSEEVKYNDLLSLYQKGMYLQVLEGTELIVDNMFRDKLLFLRARTFIKEAQNDKALYELSLISNIDQELFNESKYLIDVINNPSNMVKANEQALAGSSYLLKESSEHMVLLVLPRDGVDVTYLQTVISDFHVNSIGNDFFKISALLLGSDNHLIMIQPFNDVNESMNYFKLINEQQDIMNILNGFEHKIMPISLDNFKEFYNNRDVEGYYNFFINKYLTSN